jgi:hypothetical protein
LPPLQTNQFDEVCVGMTKNLFNSAYLNDEAAQEILSVRSAVLAEDLWLELLLDRFSNLADGGKQFAGRQGALCLDVSSDGLAFLRHLLGEVVPVDADALGFSELSSCFESSIEFLLAGVEGIADHLTGFVQNGPRRLLFNALGLHFLLLANVIRNTATAWRLSSLENHVKILKRHEFSDMDAFNAGSCVKSIHLIVAEIENFFRRENDVHEIPFVGCRNLPELVFQVKRKRPHEAASFPKGGDLF